MKRLSTPDDEDRLTEMLRGWTVDAPLPPRFQENVWNRIARSDANAPLPFWTGFARLVAGTFERPRVAYSYAAVVLALGIAAGSLTAQFKSSRLESQLGHRYVVSVDPYQQSLLSP